MRVVEHIMMSIILFKKSLT